MRMIGPHRPPRGRASGACGAGANLAWTAAATLALTAALLSPVTPAAADPVAVTVPPPGTQSVTTESVADSGLADKLSSVLADSRSTKAKTAAIVLDGTDGRELFTRYAGSPRIPASNTKLLTAAAAMHTLGENYQFRTEVLRRGRVVDGVVQGNLYLKGYGDPTSRVSDYASLARQIAAKGIRGFTGRVVVDASYFDAQRYNPYWSTGYASDYYAGQITAVTLAPNADLDSGTIFVTYRPGKTGKRGTLATVPAAAKGFVHLVNKTTTTRKGTRNTVWMHRTYGTNRITVSGHVPAGRGTSYHQITVSRPDLLAGVVLRSELRKLGVSVAKPTQGWTMPRGSRTTLGIDTSVPLKELLKPFLKLSNNMHAEALTKAMGASGGEPGSWANGLPHTLGYLSSLGVPLSGVTLVDGSGLTRSNRLTTRALAVTLKKVQSEPWFASYYAALPVAGISDRAVGGTLRRRMTGTRAAGNAHAKTGSLTGVTSLSGYVRGRDGRAYVFSLLSNYRGSTPRPVEDKLVIALANWRRD